MVFNFRLQFQPYSARTASLAQRRRDILAVHSSFFRFQKTNLHIDDYAKHSDELVAALRELGVDQIGLTRLPAVEGGLNEEAFL